MQGWFFSPSSRSHLHPHLRHANLTYRKELHINHPPRYAAPLSRPASPCWEKYECQVSFSQGSEKFGKYDRWNAAWVATFQSSNTNTPRDIPNTSIFLHNQKDFIVNSPTKRLQNGLGLSFRHALDAELSMLCTREQISKALRHLPTLLFTDHEQMTSTFLVPNCGTEQM